MPLRIERNGRLRGPPGLMLGVAFDLGMNLASVQVEHAHGDGARRPVDVADKLDFGIAVRWLDTERVLCPASAWALRLSGPIMQRAAIDACAIAVHGLCSPPSASRTMSAVSTMSGRYATWRGPRIRHSINQTRARSFPRSDFSRKCPLVKGRVRCWTPSRTLVCRRLSAQK